MLLTQYYLFVFWLPSKFNDFVCWGIRWDLKIFAINTLLKPLKLKFTSLQIVSWRPKKTKFATMPRFAQYDQYRLQRSRKGDSYWRLQNAMCTVTRFVLKWWSGLNELLVIIFNFCQSKREKTFMLIIPYKGHRQCIFSC